MSCNKDPEVYFNQGLDYYENENYEQAYDLFKKAHALSYDTTLYYDSYFWASRSLFKARNYKEAVKHFNTLIAVDSTNSKFHYYRGLTLWKWYVPSEYGMFYSSRKYMPQAVQSLTKAIEIDPYPSYFLTRAKIKTDLNDHTGAVSDLRHLISIDSTYNNILVAIADSIYEDQRNQQIRTAVFYLDAAIELDPKNSELYFKKSLYGDRKLSFIDREKEINISILNINKAIQLDPKSQKYLIRRGRLFLDRGNLKNRNVKRQGWPPKKTAEYNDDYFLALNDIQKALTLNKDSGEAYYYLGVIKLELPNENGCRDLSISGQMGYALAYNTIAERCN